MTIKIKETCCCGAIFEYEDSEQAISARAHHLNWLDKHKVCRDREPSKIKEFFK